MPDTSLTTSQVARRLGISAERVRQLVTQGVLGCQRTSLGRLFDPLEVDQLAETRRSATPLEPTQEQ